jgi:hypothetical protein
LNDLAFNLDQGKRKCAAGAVLPVTQPLNSAALVMAHDEGYSGMSETSCEEESGGEAIVLRDGQAAQKGSPRIGESN